MGHGGDYVADVAASGALAGGGRFTALCAERLRERLGCSFVFLTPSCATALELAAVLAELGPGDEAVVPSFNHPAAAVAVAKRGAVPVFADIAPDTLGLDPAAAETAVTSRTRAIMPTHYAGVACDMAALGLLADHAGLAVIEDAAHGLHADLDGRPLGSFGDAACFSFDHVKNVTSGEGGALAVNRENWVGRAQVLRDRGTNRAEFDRGEVPAYTWVELGAAAVPGELSAAYLWGQLEVAEEIVRKRLEVWAMYHERLAPAEAAGTLLRPVVSAGRRHDGHIFYVLMPDQHERDRAIQRLAEAGVQAAFHFVPLHSSPAGLRYGRTAGSLEVTDDVAARLLRLPIWPGLTERHVDRVVGALIDVARPRAVPAPA
jgi:dTDP-4-amino-4,6-dideoxygalactose transaminase